MAHVFRVGVARLAGPGFANRLCKVSQNHNIVGVAYITRCAKRTDLLPRPPPFPYWRKKLRTWHEVADPIMYRLDENSKIITVEGLPAIGKSNFAKELAKELDMLYMPPVSFDDYYVNKYGEDLRVLDVKLPARAQSCDTARFLREPHHVTVPSFQLTYFHMRMEQYMNAILHMLSTGQGVILQRSHLSDKVFMKTMFKHGYVTQTAFRAYMDVVNYAAKLLPRQQLVIYLDAPVSVITENIKKRNVPCEVESKVLTTQYLTDLDQCYREDFLNDMVTRCNVLTYDWSSKGDVEWVADEIEQLDFTVRGPQGKFSDWFFNCTGEVSALREICQSKYYISGLLRQFDKLMPEEYWIAPEALAAQEELSEQIVHEEYIDSPDPHFVSDYWKQSLKETPTASVHRKIVRDFIHRNPAWK